MGRGVRVELPDHSSTLYHGKVLEPLPALNELQVKKFECGVWSDVVPDHLRPIIQQPERYKEAIGIINSVSQTEVRFTTYWPLLLMALVLTVIAFSCVGIPLLVTETINVDEHPQVSFGITGLTALKLLFNFFVMVRSERRRIVSELQKAIGQANILLLEEKVLIGAKSNSKLLLVYVSVDGCRQELSALSQNNGLFQKVLLDYSSDYACRLSKRYFPFKPISNTCHLEGALCFCQYVTRRLSMKRWCYCCRKQYSLPALASRGVDNPSYV